MRTRHIISLALVVVSLFGLSCAWLRTRNYNVDKASPNGAYRVRIDSRVEDDDKDFFVFHEWVKIQFFKGQEIVQTREWQRTDSMEATFIGSHPVVEWVGGNVLRMGPETTKQPFLDEVMISNDSGEQLKYINVSYGRYESFMGFDMAPGNIITLRTSPEFWPDSPTPAFNFASYTGETVSGKKFEGRLQDEQRKTPAHGQLKFKITINPKDLTTPTKNER